MNTEELKEALEDLFNIRRNLISQTKKLDILIERVQERIGKDEAQIKIDIAEEQPE